MATATVDEVRAIIDTNIEDTNVESYIDSASSLLSIWFSGVTASQELLTELEKWVAAHLIAMTKERQAKEEGAGGAYIKYAGVFGTGLKTTSYGQTAIEIDTTNTLRSVSGKQIKFFAIKEGD
ncbi:MAG: hypothetical protein ACOCQD_04380 [archaeon]